MHKKQYQLMRRFDDSDLASASYKCQVRSPYIHLLETKNQMNRHKLHVVSQSAAAGYASSLSQRESHGAPCTSRKCVACSSGNLPGGCFFEG
ncbi:uncharacterized protein H6S33_006541 [Morchella sextelata]|uniref:uncharacterized protein n=1 Tax=Morchella sextelata TaxID=1174677 RepID=UPI001D05A2AC|nr:uncharacterized protein H6S33_006541 [Morchella sextelata]KAH0604873.1 hypothetical protein H6S33_006541 [Morchella sextelata]